jgi:hypothetical protein
MALAYKASRHRSQAESEPRAFTEAERLLPVVNLDFGTGQDYGFVTTVFAGERVTLS